MLNHTTKQERTMQNHKAAQAEGMAAVRRQQRRDLQVRADADAMPEDDQPISAQDQQR